jgi:hypothetical protein
MVNYRISTDRFKLIFHMKRISKIGNLRHPGQGAPATRAGIREYADGKTNPGHECPMDSGSRPTGRVRNDGYNGTGNRYEIAAFQIRSSLAFSARRRGRKPEGG